MNDQDIDHYLWRFVYTLSVAGGEIFICHARIAILDGLSPKENRTVPPLNYERVYRLKEAYPDLEIVLNGGISEIDHVEDVLGRVDGVMLGRQAYHPPYFLAELEHHINPPVPLPDRRNVVERMLPYIKRELDQGA